MRPYKKKRELANWIKRQLGEPLIQIPLDPTQIDDAIDKAVDYFAEHAGGIGNVDSIVAITPQLVFYDGTGNMNQPGPTKGRWRKNITPGTSGTSGVGTSGTSGVSGCALPDSALGLKFGGPDGNPLTDYPVLDQNGDPCRGETLPGPGWFGDGIQNTHCFIETQPSDPDAVGPFWVEGDTPCKPMYQGYIWKSIYDVPSDIIAIHENLAFFGIGSSNGALNEDNALFSPYSMMFQGGGNWGQMNSGSYVDNRWGFWQGGGTGSVDIVSWQMGMQTLEMYRQMFTVHMTAQLLEMEHKVRILNKISGNGVISFACTRKVAEEHLYNHQAVKELALAHAMITLGYATSKYGNITMPGGGTINGAMYLERGDALRTKMEEQIYDRYSLPGDFYMG